MRFKVGYALLATALAALGLLAGEGDDGPYVRWAGGRATALRARDGVLTTEVVKGGRLDLPGLAPGPLLLSPKAPAAAEDALPLPSKVLALSDIHGQRRALVDFLRAQGVVDAQLRWTFGRGHLVIVGDVLDRGDEATECLWVLRALEPAARAKGGRVHLLLGNHEAMVLQGDLRYLHPKYPRLCEQTFQAPMPALYGPDTELGRWLRTRATLLRLGPFLFLHGGLDPSRHPGPLDLKALNAAVRAGLDQDFRATKHQPAFDSQGPLWYRGLLPGVQPAQEATSEAIAALLDRNHLKAMVVGHTTLDHAAAFHGGRVYAVDAGFKEGRAGEGWLWAQGAVWRALADGSKVPFEAP